MVQGHICTIVVSFLEVRGKMDKYEEVGLLKVGYDFFLEANQGYFVGGKVLVSIRGSFTQEKKDVKFHNGGSWGLLAMNQNDKDFEFMIAGKSIKV